MTHNVGPFDGWFRSLLFVLSICYAVIVGGSAWLWVIPTAILFTTALLSWCPLYEMIGWNTNSDTKTS